jgi:hypothetical protein
MMRAQYPYATTPLRCAHPFSLPHTAQVEIGKVKSELDQFTSDPDKVSGTTDNLIENSRPTKTLDQLKKIRETGEPLVKNIITTMTAMIVCCLALLTTA